MPFQEYNKIFDVTETGFENLALEVFLFQARHNPVYKSYIEVLQIDPLSVKKMAEIPFLPVSFFKSHEVLTTFFEPEVIFESSGTTDIIKSRHFLRDIFLYEQSFVNGFERFYGTAKDWCILGLLPSYLERNNSSLVYMVEKLIKLSGHPQSGFYLNEFEKLFSVLKELEKQNQKTLLIGVTFALLDFAEKYSLPLQQTIIMETGGMKGRREELVRNEVHKILKNAFHLSSIHSEYGMTELLSQAYSKGEGIFHCPPWMKVMVRDENDPLALGMSYFKSMAYIAGAINIIDLANIYSCSFIATDDVGRIYADGSFEILGRIDNSDLRGCSLMTI